jgi:hypothetical protein
MDQIILNIIGVFVGIGMCAFSVHMQNRITRKRLEEIHNETLAEKAIPQA